MTKLLGGADGKKPKRRHARKRESIMTQETMLRIRQRKRIKSRKGNLYFKSGKLFVWILGIIASVVGIWQFAIVDPELRALDFGSDPFEVIVTLRNSLW